MNEVITKPAGVVATMAARYNMDAARFKQTLIGTVIPKGCSDEQFAAFMLVAKEYDLNPFTREIYAFASRGGVQPIVSIDGWMKIINAQINFDGMEFTDELDDEKKLVSITCTIYRKDRQRPISVTEYMAECVGQSEPWKKWPARMLRHKAAIQCARYAFGFSGIMEPDEYERLSEVEKHARQIVEVNPLDDEPITTPDIQEAKIVDIEPEEITSSNDNVDAFGLSPKEETRENFDPVDWLFSYREMLEKIIDRANATDEEVVDCAKTFYDERVPQTLRAKAKIITDVARKAVCGDMPANEAKKLIYKALDA